MAGNKTRDGIKLTNILRAAEDIGANIRYGTNHPNILNYPKMRPCPIASSTHAERMVAPWIAQASGRTKEESYQAIRQGYWKK